MGVAAGLIGSSVVSGLMGKKSGDKQAKISDRQYQQTRSDLEPWREAGTNALGQYQEGMGGYSNALPQYQAADYQSPDNFQFSMEDDVGAQYGIDQALKGVSRQHAAQGGFNSGNVLAALNDRAIGESNRYSNDAFNRQMGQSRENYGRDMADYGIRDERSLRDYNIASGQERDLYGRDQNYLNRLQNLSGSGQNAAAQMGGFGAQNVGNQMAAEQYGTGSINNAIQGGMSNYMLQNYLNSGNQVPTIGSNSYTDSYGYGVG